MSEANNQASPSPEQFEACLRVLRWMRDGDRGLHESWQIPLTHICGCVRGCLEISKAERAGGRAPAAVKTAETKHVGISDLLAVAAEFKKTADKCRNKQAAAATAGESAVSIGWKVAAESYEQAEKCLNRLAEKATPNSYEKI